MTYNLPMLLDCHILKTQNQEILRASEATSISQQETKVLVPRLVVGASGLYVSDPSLHEDHIGEPSSHKDESSTKMRAPQSGRQGTYIEARNTERIQISFHIREAKTAILFAMRTLCPSHKDVQRRRYNFIFLCCSLVSMYNKERTIVVKFTKKDLYSLPVQ